MTTSIDGLYLIECAGDNHPFYELYKYRKGERLWKYFEGKKHANGLSMVKPMDITKPIRDGSEERRHPFMGFTLSLTPFKTTQNPTMAITLPMELPKPN